MCITLELDLGQASNSILTQTINRILRREKERLYVGIYVREGIFVAPESDNQYDEVDSTRRARLSDR